MATGASIIVLNQDTFDASVDGWTNAASPGHGAPYGTLSHDPALGGQQALKVNNQFAGAVEDFIYAPADMEGNWATTWAYPVRKITFDFYTDAGGAVDYPSALEVYFLHDETGDNYYWRYTIDVTTLSQGWNSIDIAVDGGGWYSPGNPGYGAPQFLVDSWDVDEVGILLTYQNWAGQIYGIDDFTLGYLVPEPSTYAVLAFAFLSLGVTFRKKLSETFKFRRR